MNSTLPALPTGWIDRLFARFSGLYGKHWLDLWADVPMPQVMATWQDALQGCTGEQIRQALEHCTANNKYPPTCSEFVALCRQFYVRPLRPPDPPRLPSPMPQHQSAPIARLNDGRDWARQIIALDAAGKYPYPYHGVALAREALASLGTQQSAPAAKVETMPKAIQDMHIRKLIERSWGPIPTASRQPGEDDE